MLRFCRCWAAWWPALSVDHGGWFPRRGVAGNGLGVVDSLHKGLARLPTRMLCKARDHVKVTSLPCGLEQAVFVVSTQLTFLQNHFRSCHRIAQGGSTPTDKTFRGTLAAAEACSAERLGGWRRDCSTAAYFKHYKRWAPRQLRISGQTRHTDRQRVPGTRYWFHPIRSAFPREPEPPHLSSLRVSCFYPLFLVYGGHEEEGLVTPLARESCPRTRGSRDSKKADQMQSTMVARRLQALQAHRMRWRRDP
ncbi:hypothetical protein BD289DRAFT_28406 [Coniella lustricola]|uniref:Uncharacterized protein n=1 Tax=Coniella lustricola TaxID=2025994 RepID=A0A2T3AJ71_9PEZI|nr:hypothetical protein BD289DRAFT_28406 [Coniella lustricola]